MLAVRSLSEISQTEMGVAAIFTPGEPISIKGNFSPDNSNADSAASHSYIWRDSTGSLFNPFHNYSAVRYTGLSRLPKLDTSVEAIKVREN